VLLQRVRRVSVEPDAREYDKTCDIVLKECWLTDADGSTTRDRAEVNGRLHLPS